MLNNPSNGYEERRKYPQPSEAGQHKRKGKEQACVKRCVTRRKGIGPYKPDILQTRISYFLVRPKPPELRLAQVSNGGSEKLHAPEIQEEPSKDVSKVLMLVRRTSTSGSKLALYAVELGAVCAFAA